MPSGLIYFFIGTLLGWSIGYGFLKDKKESELLSRISKIEASVFLIHEHVMRNRQ